MIVRAVTCRMSTREAAVSREALLLTIDKSGRMLGPLVGVDMLGLRSHKCSKIRAELEPRLSHEPEPRVHGNVAAGSARGAAEGLVRNRGFAAAVILTMALGIGANSAIFSVVHGVLLRPLPYANGDDILILRQQRPLAGIQAQGFSPLEMEDYRQQAKTLESIVEYHNMWFVLLGRGEPERVATGVVSWNYFDLFGVRPVAGRTFRSGDDAHGADAVLVLSNAYWKSRFGGDPNVVGQVFEMNDRPHTVIGVLPPIPQFPDENDVYMPVSACPFRSSEGVRTNRNARMVQAFGRLRTRSDRAGGVERSGDGRVESPAGLPGELPGERRFHCDGAVAARRADARVPADALDSARRRGLSPAHRVRERRQPDARAPVEARARAGDSDVARRRPLAPRASAPDREHAPRARRCRRRSAVRVGDDGSARDACRRSSRPGRRRSR